MCQLFSEYKCVFRIDGARSTLYDLYSELITIRKQTFKKASKRPVVSVAVPSELILVIGDIEPTSLPSDSTQPGICFRIHHWSHSTHKYFFEDVLLLMELNSLI